MLSERDLVWLRASAAPDSGHSLGQVFRVRISRAAEQRLRTCCSSSCTFISFLLSGKLAFVATVSGV
ncbi:hypothetical protein CYMTET_54838 [Cymbomonas tetramitiformis]|uniref:Uncharacterized protein n=1 Tax=Cymbomonas tetramitiformis TaxID=36881 RepID=A0AAE0BFA9_9CHLO|nr:hypothetical protein CYMTET_54838 [Cymbomonas tetramitiformis]